MRKNRGSIWYTSMMRIQMTEEGCQGTLDEASVLFVCGINEVY